jgi:hypothetical protein
MARNMLAFGIFAAFVSVSHFATDGSTPTWHGPIASAAQEPDAVATMFAAHDCWTGKAPADVFVPGHVVLTRGANGPEYLGEVWVGKALGQLFNDVDAGIVKVHGFCR